MCLPSKSGLPGVLLCVGKALKVFTQPGLETLTINCPADTCVVGARAIDGRGVFFILFHIDVLHHDITDKHTHTHTHMGGGGGNDVIAMA